MEHQSTESLRKVEEDAGEQELVELDTSGTSEPPIGSRSRRKARAGTSASLMTANLEPTGIKPMNDTTEDISTLSSPSAPSKPSTPQP
jgi:hypothetical protein